MEAANELSFDELLQEVQQQFIGYKESSDKRFQDLEEMIDLAAQKMEILKKRKAQRKMTVNCVNLFARTITIFTQEEVSESLHYLERSFPKFIEGSGVAKWIQECEQYFSVFKVGDSKKVEMAGIHLEDTARLWFQSYATEENSFAWSEFCKQFTARFEDREQLYDNFKQPQHDTTEELKESTHVPKKMEVFIDLADADGKTYTGEPIYDEEPGKGQECWIEKEFILAALKEGNSKLSNLLQSEICASERSEELVEISNIQNFQQKRSKNKAPYGGPEFKDQQNVCQQACLTLLLKEEPAKSLAHIPSKVLEDGYKPKLVDYQGGTDEEYIKWGITKEESKAESSMKLRSSGLVLEPMSKIVDSYKVGKKQGANKAVSSRTSTHMEQVPEAFLRKITIKDFPTVGNSYSLCKRSSTFGEKHVLIFDPGGYVQNNKSKYVTKKLNEAVAITSACGQLEDIICWKLTIDQLMKEQQLWKVFMIQMVNADRIQGVGHQTDGVVSEVDMVGARMKVIEELNEDVPCRDGPIAANYFGLERNSSHLPEKSMIIFDPGGLVQEDHSKGVNVMLKDMISSKEVKLGKAALINSACGGQPGQWQGHPKVVVPIEISDEKQGRLGKPGRVLRLEVHEASRKRDTITIFDPGGCTSCLDEVQFVSACWKIR